MRVYMCVCACACVCVLCVCVCVRAEIAVVDCSWATFTDVIYSVVLDATNTFMYVGTSAVISQVTLSTRGTVCVCVCVCVCVYVCVCV